MGETLVDDGCVADGLELPPPDADVVDVDAAECGAMGGAFCAAASGAEGAPACA